MAKITKHLTVCDEGLERCNNDNLHRVRITVDGRTRTAVLCDKHVDPWVKLRDTGRKAPSRGKIYTLDEIARQRRSKEA